MNLIGKILVVIITVMSIAFLGIAIVLYSTHNNWKATIDAQQARLTELNADLEALQSQYKQNVNNLQLEIETAEQQIRKLERERVALLARNEEIESSIDDLQQARRDLTTDIASTQAENKRLGEENADIEQDIAAAQAVTNTSFEQAIEATSQLHEAKIKLETELERNAQLLEQVEGNL